MLEQNERRKSWCEHGVRDIVRGLGEFSGGEQATRWDQHLVQLVHDRGLAYPRITGHEHELGYAIVYNAVEGSEQRVDLPLAPIQLLGDKQTVRRIVSA